MSQSLKLKNQRITFSVDADNRLLIKKPLQSKTVTARGRFTTTKDNDLIFTVNEKTKWRKSQGLEKTFAFKGTWRLDDNYDLVLDVRDKKKLRHQLILKGEIIETKGNALLFQIKGNTSSQVTTWYHLKLRGIWQADTYNRITFEVRKSDNPDRLVFKGAWKLNKDQYLTYTYVKTLLKTKRKVSHILIFDGFWRIAGRNKLSFILTGAGQSQFDFQVRLASDNVYPQKGAIKYRLGIGVASARTEKILTLYGTWKFGRRFDVIFEIKYGSGALKATAFSTSVRFSKTDTVLISLKDIHKKPLGITLVYKRKLMTKNALEYFLRLRLHPRRQKRRDKHTPAVEIGGSVRF